MKTKYNQKRLEENAKLWNKAMAQGLEIAYEDIIGLLQKRLKKVQSDAKVDSELVDNGKD